MNDSMEELIIMSAIAIKQKHGDVACATFLRTNGWTTNKAFSFIEAWEDIKTRVDRGEIGNYPGLSAPDLKQ